MKQGRAKKALLGLTAVVLALTVFLALLGTGCLGALGCAVACLTCGESCERIGDTFDTWTRPTREPMWDGPGSIQTTPEPTKASEATSRPTAAPSSAPTGEFGGQSKADGAVRDPRVQLKNDGTDTVTVLVLMNGSDLESEYGEATEDLSEMVKASKGDRMNVLVETVGTRKWDSRYGISSRRSERYLVTDTGLTLVDGSLGQLDTTIPTTLSDFIRWGAQNSPADRYILILWDHGGGPVYGFGYDEYQSYDSSLTIDEMQIALRDGGVYFDLIGMDCCLMSSLEVCCALYEYCDYTLLSEDFEPAIGWSHTGWLNALGKNPAISTPELAKIVIDDSVRACEKNLEEDGGTTLALMDEAYMKLLYAAWVDFAYANEDALLNANYSQLRQSNGGRVHPRIRGVGDWFSDEDDATLDDYYVTDILAVAQNIDSDRANTLCAALNAAMVYYGATSDETTLTGLSVTLPYGDDEFYTELKRVFRAAGFDEDYIDWLERFTEVESRKEDYVDYGDWGDLWGGWGADDGYDDWDDWWFSDLWEDEDWSDEEWADDDWFSSLFGGH